MLRSRIIPCLLLHNKGLVKTIGFSEPRYVGDPINAVKIFNEKEVDELIVLDIDASVQGREPDYRLIKNMAVECRMPFCYGGGVKTAEQAKTIISLGAEKIALSSAAVENYACLSAISNAVGVQSVVVVLDVKRKKLFGGFELYIHNGQKATGIKLNEMVERLNKTGVGEIVINSIDKDGRMDGYDISLIDQVREITDIPITALGGAGSMDDIKKLIARYKIIGAAAGSLFVFKGKFRAVLINYPNQAEKKPLYQIANETNNSIL
jgi:cyclase